MPFLPEPVTGIGIGGVAQRGGSVIEVHLPNIPLWVPQAARATLNSLALQTMRLALQEAAGQISDRAPVGVSGNLAQSIAADPAGATGGIELLGVDLTTDVTGRVFSSLPYAVVMNDGRRAGAPISREGVDSIGLWAQRKLGLTAAQADRAKWAIATAIVAHGIEGTHYFDEGIDAARPRIEQLFDILADAITAGLTSQKGGQA